MRKTLLFVISLLATTTIFWGCDDEKTTVSTEYVPVKVTDVLDTIELEPTTYTKLDTIIDTISGDTGFTTSLSNLKYGEILFSEGSFSCTTKTVFLQQEYVKKTIIVNDVTIYDTISTDTTTAIVVHSSDTFNIVEITPDLTTYVIDTSKAFGLLFDTIYDTAITDNNSYLMSINGSSAGFLGLGYAFYGNESAIGISGLKNVGINGSILCTMSDIFILSSNNLQKISKSIVSDTTATTDTLLFSVTSTNPIMKAKGDTLFVSLGNDSVYVIDISAGNLTLLNTIAVAGSISDITLIGSTALINTKADSSNDALKAIDTGVVTFVPLLQKGINQVISSFNDSLLFVLTPKQDSVAHGVLEITNFSTALHTTVGSITSARYLPENIADFNMISETQGYVLDADNGVLYQINFTSLNFATTFDFLTEVTTDVSTYTFDDENIFISKTDGTLAIYSHSNIGTTVKETTLSGGAASSLSILN